MNTNMLINIQMLNCFLKRIFKLSCETSKKPKLNPKESKLNLKSTRNLSNQPDLTQRKLTGTGKIG